MNATIAGDEPDGSSRSENEGGAVVAGFLLFFLVFASYFMLRPVRETFGLAGGVDNLQWLYLGTFLGALVAVPLFGWVSARLPRSTLVPVTYVFSALVMGGFALSLLGDPDNVWIGRAFYIWLSVMNLFVISIAWSLMADVLNPDQAKRLFARLAGGASLGGLVGPLTSGFLVESVGHAGLLLISTGLLLGALFCVAYLLRWRTLYGRPADAVSTAQPIGGGIWAGLVTIARSKQLLAISLFVLLLTATSTFLYFEQARVVDATFTDREEQTQVFASIDAAVQAATILIQLFLTGFIARRFGVVALLTAVPLVIAVGFLVLAVIETFPVLVAVMFVRRVGEYAMVRPGREMLFSAVPAEIKYKSKNAIDTAVYRGGDVISAWLNTAIVAVGSSAIAAIGGAVIALAWAATGFSIGRRFDAERKRTMPDGVPQ